MHAVEFVDAEGEVKCGVILRRSAPLAVYELLSAEQLSTTEVVLHEAWALDKHELLASVLASVKKAAFLASVLASVKKAAFLASVVIASSSSV